MRHERLNQAATQIRKANSILLACHVRPDADALGSLLGLMLGLERLGKQVDAVSQDGVPETYRFLPGWEKVLRTPRGPYDLAIGLDADGSDRLGSAEAAVLGAPVTIDIDHHTGPDPFGAVQVVDPTAAATGELVLDLLTALGLEPDADIARCLLAAILTDTGSFRFGNVTEDTFRKAGALVAAGAHPAPIHEAIYGVRPFEASCLLGRLLGTLKRSTDGRIVWGSLSQVDFRETGSSTEATEGFVDQVRMVAGSLVAVFAREEVNGEVRVSIRSRGDVNVARVADRFGGGGHVAAAGCTLSGPLDEAVDRVIAAATAELARATAPDVESAGKS
ncbi:MAG: Exopolyphosphatase-related protein [Armatimonadetes bacterium]|nr:Exopolyphosphatase-related protein [Armatimonadota bacterium]